MSAIRKRSIAKIDNEYVQQREIAGIAETRKRKLLFRRLAVFTAFAAAITYLMISMFVSQTSVLAQKQAEKDKLDRQLEDLQKREEILKEEVVRLNDDDYIAKLARRDYFLSEDNEIIFNLPKDEKEKKSE
ncbi:FtsB family cell division protein [Mesobacillus zeae]|uniref:Septum formation initiator family protein n=1 Tax=Mesobacillus zeae TaxID=1917180 RepID=A0A398BEK9_9BACI|nr:septum formation initiator family protein [Mesobacillus zeae]RID88655.1 septum formation initiator family protein [Mesobacillus zeae]